MLNSLRRSTGSLLAKLLFILLVISFAAWGIGDFLGPSADTAVATVGDTEIGEREFTTEFNRQVELLRQRFGGQLDRETAIALGAADQVLSRLVSRRLLALEADELDLRVGDDLVLRRIHEEEAFQDAAGRFSRERFEQLLFANGMTEEGYVQRLRAELMRGEVATAVASGGIVPPDVTEILYRHRNEQRVADLLHLPLTHVTGVPAPDANALAAYYEENMSQFEEPEYRQVTAIVLTPDAIAEQLTVPEDRVREAYDARLNEFRTPERRTITQLLFGSENEKAARTAAGRLSTGAPFAEVSEEAVAAGAERTEIGEVRRGELFPAVVEEAAFALQQPGTTEPVRSPLGWHVLEVTEIEPGSTRPFEEVADTVRMDLAREVAVEHLYDIGNQLQDELAAGHRLEEAAQRLDLPLEKIPAISRRGLTPDGSQVTGIPRSGPFLNEAFSTPAGEESLLEETPDGGYYVLRVDSVTPPAIPPLEEIRDKVEMAWRGQKLAELAEEAAQKIAADIREGAPFEQVADEAGLDHRRSSAFTRDTDLPGQWLPGDLVARLFAAGPEEIVVQRGGDGFYVGRVVEAIEPDPSAAPDALARIRAEMEQSVRADLETQFQEALRERHGVAVREDALRRLLL